MKLTNYAKPSGQTRNHVRYRWRVFLDEPEAVLNSIEAVEYRLHETFPDPIRTVTNRTSKFALESSGWGEFTIYATIHYVDGHEENTTYTLNLSKKWSDEDEMPALNIPEPPPEEKITQQHIALTSTSWRDAKRDGDFHPHKMYRFDVIVAASDEVLNRIAHVTYFLPPAWPPSSSPRSVEDRASKFKLKDLAWGDLIVRAEVRFLTQPEMVSLSCFVQLHDSGPRL